MSNTQLKEHCHHCGEACDPQNTVQYAKQCFCCEGCKTVYALLNEAGLTDYYCINEAPGEPQKKNNSGAYDFLDLAEARGRIIEFNEGSRSKVTFYIPNIHCASCIWLLEKLNRLDAGVLHTEVNFLRRELCVWFNEEAISLRALVELLGRIGYAPDLGTQRTQSWGASKALLLKLGVAGFAFGNIMLFSFPEYLSMDDTSLGFFKPVFGYLNFLLALPVLLYSDTDYLRSAWNSIRLRYLTIDVPIALGIVALFGRSTWDVLSGAGPGFFDSFAGLIFFLLLGKWFQSRTYESLAFERDFKSYFPMAVARVTPDGETPCMIENLRVGDRIRLRTNQILPADGVLLSDKAEMDYSFVSGESDRVIKHKGDQLYAGGRHCGAPIEVEVKKEVNQSQLTALWNQPAFRKMAEDSGIGSLINRVSRVFSKIVLSVAFVTLVYWMWVDRSEAMNAFTAVLIIACPCALALSMPFTSGNASRILARLGFFVKNASTLERMANVDDIVFDKTGTLSELNSRNVTYSGSPLNADEMAMVHALASASVHPLSVSVRDFMIGKNLVADEVDEVPGLGVSGRCNGFRVSLGSTQMPEFVHELEPARPVEGSTLQSSVHLWIQGKYRGAFLIEKSIRPGVREMLTGLRGKAQLHLVSGDNDSEKVLYRSLLGADAQIHFNQQPTDKLNYIKSLTDKGRRVLMFGDGLNDAGALKQAAVGVAVADDVFSFSPACDAILKADKLQYADAYMAYARKSLNTVMASVIISSLYNAVGLFFAVRSELTPVMAAIIMPLSSVSVVGFVTALTWYFRPRIRR